MAGQKLDFTSATCGDLSCKVGLTFSQQLLWNTETAPESDVFNPVDLTGYTAKMQVRQGVNQPVILELSTENGLMTLGGTAGTITLSVPANTGDINTAGLSDSIGIFNYDLLLKDPNGNVSQFVYGLFEIAGIITQ